MEIVKAILFELSAALALIELIGVALFVRNFFLFRKPLS